jgi:hypothetical protein
VAVIITTSPVFFQKESTKKLSFFFSSLDSIRKKLCHLQEEQFTQWRKRKKHKKHFSFSKKLKEGSLC